MVSYSQIYASEDVHMGVIMGKESKRKYHNTKEQLKEKLENLKKIIAGFDEKVCDEIKAYRLCQFYNSAERFRRAYQLISDSGREDPMFAEYITRFDEIYEFYLNGENTGIIDDANYIIKTEPLLQVYPYARYIIEDYIMSDSCDEKEILETLGITKDNLRLCVQILEEADVDLYKKYLLTVEKNKALTKEKNKSIMQDLANGITNGYLEDGAEFNMLEFLKRIPFKDAPNPFQTLKDFTKKNLPDDYLKIIMYMADNKLNDRAVYNFAKEEVIRGIKSTINGRFVTQEDNDIILAYMKQNNYPLYPIVFREVRRQYLDGKISETDIKPEKVMKKV